MVLAQKETFIIGEPEYSKIKKIIKEHALELFPEHIGHTFEFQEDSPRLLWIKCITCGKLWDMCDFCKLGRGSLDLGCRKCKKDC